MKEDKQVSYVYVLGYNQALKEVKEIVNAYLCKYVCKDRKNKNRRDGILDEIEGLKKK